MLTEYLLCAGHCARHSGKDSEMDKVTVLKEWGTWQGRTPGFQSSTQAVCVTGPAQISPGLSSHMPLSPQCWSLEERRDGLLQAGPHAVLPPLGEPAEAGRALQHASEGLAMSAGGSTLRTGGARRPPGTCSRLWAMCLGRPWVDWV